MYLISLQPAAAISMVRSTNFDAALPQFHLPTGQISLPAVQAGNAGVLNKTRQSRAIILSNYTFHKSTVLLLSFTMNSDKSKLKSSSITFSAELVRLYDKIEGKAFLKNQLARAGTGIGSNIHEAGYAESSADFVHKLRLALKECHECEYWLLILIEACPYLAEDAVKMRRTAGSIRRMLIASINTVIHNHGVE